jgi:hypothetical protein
MIKSYKTIYLAAAAFLIFSTGSNASKLQEDVDMTKTIQSLGQSVRKESANKDMWSALPLISISIDTLKSLTKPQLFKDGDESYSIQLLTQNQEDLMSFIKGYPAGMPALIMVNRANNISTWVISALHTGSQLKINPIIMKIDN